MSISLHLDGGLKAVVPFKCSERDALAGQSSRVEKIMMGSRMGGDMVSGSCLNQLLLLFMGYHSSILLMRSGLCELQITVVGYA